MHLQLVFQFGVDKEVPEVNFTFYHKGTLIFTPTTVIQRKNNAYTPISSAQGLQSLWLHKDLKTPDRDTAEADGSDLHR